MPWALPEAATSSAQRARLAKAEDLWSSGSDFTYLLLPRDNSRLLGVLGLHRRVGPHAIELGYWLAHDALGHGYATRAAEALTTAALNLADVRRVEIRCDEANLRSQRIPQRLGYHLDRVEEDEATAAAEIGRSMIWIFPPST
jgi:RimJ/RimL family protein N-acetyltransferase